MDMTVGKVRFIGNSATVESDIKVIKMFPAVVEQKMTEAEARLLLQRLMEEGTIKLESVLYDGNGVCNKIKLLNNVRLILKSNDMSKMSDYFYHFLSLDCGSIAHYNKAGWIDEYPTPVDLRKFFARNEMGARVVDYQPRWKSDARAAAEAIEALLNKAGAIKLPKFKVTLWTAHCEWDDVEAEDGNAALRKCGYPPEFDGNDAHRWSAEKIEAGDGC